MFEYNDAERLFANDLFVELKEKRTLLIQSFVQKFSTKDFDPYDTVSKLIADDIIEYSNNTKHFIKLTPKGQSMADDFVSHLEAEKRKKEREIKKEEIEFRKLIWDANISKFQAKTRFAPLIISIISLGIAVYATLKPKSEIKELKVELQQIKDTISVLYQTKMDDSVYIKSIPFYQHDSLKPN